MSVKTTMKCDHVGYCYTPTITPGTDEQDGWFEIKKEANSVIVRRLSPADLVDVNVKHACPSHGREIAEDTIGALDIFRPHAVAKEKELLAAEVASENSI